MPGHFPTSMGSIAAVATLSPVSEYQRLLHARLIVLPHRILPARRAATGTIKRIERHSASAGSCARAGEPTQHTDVPAKKTRALENATASAGAPLSKSSAEGSPLPSLKPQPMGSATTADLVDQSAPAENTSPSSRERPSPQTAQATSPATAAGSPDLPAVATASVAEPNAAASDARADSLRPTLDARTRDDAEGPARGGPSTASTTGTAISLTGTLGQMFLIVAAGLGVASLLYRVVTAAARRTHQGRDNSPTIQHRALALPGHRGIAVAQRNLAWLVFWVE